MKPHKPYFHIKTALKFAFREQRAVVQNFKIFFASLFLGTLIMAGVGSVTANISGTIKQDGQSLLGGDIEISQIQQPLSNPVKSSLASSGRLSEIAVLKSMIRSDNDSSLVDLKAVDNAYPLYGNLSLSQGEYHSDMLSNRGGLWGILLSDVLAIRLHLAVDDVVTLGIEQYQVRGIIAKEPDVSSQGFQLAPRAMISMEGLLNNNLIQPGSLVRYYGRIKLNQGISSRILINSIKITFPDGAMQIKDSSSGGAGLARFVRRMGQFMTLVGLTALLVGGVGVSNAVYAYLDRKIDTIATYKILGATGRMILLIYLFQILIVATAAIILGLIVGAVLPIFLSAAFGDNFPIAFKMRLYSTPLLLAAFYSFIVAVIFTLWPLGRAVGMPAARLFRQTVSPKQSVKQSMAYILIIGGLLVLLISVVVYMSEFPLLTGVTLGSIAVTMLILWGLSIGAKMIARKCPRPKNSIFRIGLSNIYRSGNATSSIILSLGLGLILFTAIILIENNINREITDRVNNEAPTFFLIDIQQSQKDDIIAYLKNRSGVEAYRMVPNLRGRITHVKSIQSAQVPVTPDGEWILRGDKGITFTHVLPDDNIIVAGRWWGEDYEGPPEVSISQQMADSMGLVIGDDITVNILGRDFTLPIASIRRFSWQNFGINYVMMVDPKSLKSAPYTYVATAKTKDTDEAAVYEELYQKFPNVSIIRMKDILDNILILFQKISYGVDVMAAMTIISGILVLSGAIATGHKVRIYEAAVMKVIGATRMDIIKAYAIEFIFLGGLVGGVALVMGSLAAYGIVTYIMGMSWVMPLNVPIWTILGSIIVTLLFGMGSIWLSISVRPSQILRNQ